MARLNQWPLKCRSRILGGGGEDVSDGRGYNHHTHIFVSTRTTSSTQTPMNFLFPFLLRSAWTGSVGRVNDMLMHELGFY